MGWWWSSDSPKSESEPTPSPPNITTIPPTKASNPDADFHAAYPHLEPAKPKSDASFEPDPEYPTTMSCRAAFDAAFYCASFGGHFNDIYRYGEMRSCSEHWADWRFCMSLTGSSPEAKAAHIQERYKEKEANMKVKPNSENVWAKRRPEERIQNPFSKAEEEAKRVENS
ncbi:hypothetical protein BS50DRAFT_578845 [Corynespora cassiicola Philippines]|uniref:DUF3128 domain-containing protein n=1 Tax=Corynespora cassiicola Philippines TaxID=1448308 RepID=A0A2T2N730_CORCC|nr:hypothetical protein BS50DRAFT_578845 [Corynespora cassiicola Philippines]